MQRRTPGLLASLTALVLILGTTAATTASAGATAPGVDDPVRPASVYTARPGFEVDESRRVAVAPDAAYAFGVDLGAARAALGASRTFALPDPDGRLQQFTVVEDPVLDPVSAAAHPEITTWAGRSVSDPRVTLRLDVTPLGLHASVRSLTGSGTWYVDPVYVARGASTTVSYYAADLAPSAAERTFVEGDVQHTEAVTGVPLAAPQAGGLVTRTTYRLAMVNDPSYASYFGAGNVLAAKTTLVNRVNQIYNDDFGVHLELNGDPDLNLATNAKAYNGNGPCGASACFSSGALDDCMTALDENQSAVDRIVGKSSYDVGHVVLGKNGGGVAYLGVVGNPNLKGGGCTGLPTPVGDFFAIDYVAHELGHQFGADHTFAGPNGACGGNGNPSTAVEPGSGSSVMAYAGICGDDDLQPHTDPYFSHASIAQVRDYLAQVPSVGTDETTSNHAPTVTAPADRTIPARTPFTLTASGNDADGDPLTYLWEQSDPAVNHALLNNNNKASGPLFRVFGTRAEVTDDGALESPSPGENLATGDPSRTFPDLVQVLGGDTNAESGSCPAGDLDCFSEYLPTSSRTLHFVVTARDGYPTGGGTGRDTVALTVDASTGPFEVTSQAGGESVTGGTSGTVTWSVNGTDDLAADVRVLLSTDGGQTFPTTLIDSTPNDGKAFVTWPVGDTTEARIMVQAVDGYFFDVNDAPFTISGSAAGPPDTAITSGPTDGGFSLADVVTFGYTASSEAATFDCALDAVDQPCASPSVELAGIEPGTHVFAVAASDDNGADPSPATSRWARPYGVTVLAAKGGWTAVSNPASYLGLARQTSRRGATLTTTVPTVTAVALVVGTGRGYGRLQVKVGGVTVGTVTTSSSTGRRQVLKVLPAFAPRSGTLTIRTLDGKPVRVEGVGYLTAG